MSLLSICLSWIVSAVALQQPSVLDALRSTSDSASIQIDYEFTAVTSGIRSFGDGRIELQGNSYHMNGNGIEIFCDGKTTWMLDEQAKEVIIESAESNSAGYLANPVLLLMNLEENSVLYDVEGNLIRISLPDGTRLDVTVKGMKPLETIKPEAFRPPVEFGSDWIVTDLR